MLETRLVELREMGRSSATQAAHRIQALEALLAAERDQLATLTMKVVSTCSSLTYCDMAV